MSLPDVKPTPKAAEEIPAEGSSDQPHRQVRRRRKSGEVLMARQATVGAGLNQLDSMIGEMNDIKRATLPTTRSVGHRSAASFLLTSALVLALSVLLPMVTHPRELLEAAGWQPSVCDDSCVHANDGACDDGGACRDGSDCGACGAREASLPVPSWAVIVASLVSIAVLSLGVSTVGEMARSAGGSWGRVPLTDATLGTAVLNKFANSAQVREKGLKVLQYVLKAGAYSRLFSAGLTKQLKDLSKATSTARRFFKFCRWVKHFEDRVLDTSRHLLVTSKTPVTSRHLRALALGQGRRDSPHSPSPHLHAPRPTSGPERGARSERPRDAPPAVFPRRGQLRRRLGGGCLLARARRHPARGHAER